jgi:predicted GIY-YIG superfamily endonuclease
MFVKIQADIVKGDIETVTSSGTVIIKNAILNANTGAPARLEKRYMTHERGSLLSSIQMVAPMLTLTREECHDLPYAMQAEIRKKLSSTQKEVSE